MDCMDAESLTKENVVFFFNKYKYNSDLIYHLERKLLKESYDFEKWETLRTKNSELTRELFKENEGLIEEYINPAIKNPELLSAETLQTFMLHQTFFLFENNIDSHLIDDMIESVLKHCEILAKPVLFSARMNLGISKTISMSDTFINTLKCFEKALGIYPNFSSTDDYNTKIHLVFCRTYEMLAFCLFKSSDYRQFLDIYNKTCEMLDGGTDELYAKMWGEKADFKFHVEYLKRFFRIYGIFTAGQNYFSSIDGGYDENDRALHTICDWLKEEYRLQTQEGEVNLMIFTYYHIFREHTGEISKVELFKIFEEKFEEILAVEPGERPRVFPESAFPDEGDPVDPKFSRMLDKMKLFNRTFSYLYVFLQNFLVLSENRRVNRKIVQEMVLEFENTKYSQKGFTTDKFVIEIMKTAAQKFETEKDFLLLIQSIFVHRQICSTIHFGMISSLSGICLYRILNERPDLCVIPGIFPTIDDVVKNKIEILKLIKNAALLHDIGKAGLTKLVNLQFRKITDSEFNKLRLHPNFGKSIIQDVPYLYRYMDFVEGHHKFWNDQQGYPENFRLSSSPYKNLINLISICDMIDTTTDTKGRNYARQLTFEEMLEEMRRCSGTRYNPELVDFITGNNELLKELKEIVTAGRNYNSFQTYQNFIKPNTSFSVEDEKSIDPFDDSHLPKLAEFYKTCFPDAEDEGIKTHIEELLDGKNRRIFVLHDSLNRIFGFFAGRICNPINGETPYCFVDEIIIHPAHRRVGHGTEMMNHALEKLKEEKINRMKLSTVNNYDVESFFWIAGFSQTSRFLMEKEF